MKKYMLDLILKENKTLSDQYSLLILTSNEKIPDILPGQFAEVRVDGSPTTFLRRPISIHYVDYELNELWLLIQVIGDGTRRLSNMNVGESLNLLMPLGNSFNDPADKNAKVLLIGGGCGVAPLLYLGAHLKNKGFEVNFLLGARTRKDLIELCEYERFGNVFTTTEDGSHGERGFVTQHSLLNSPNFDYIYTCGPTPMMKAVARYAHKTKANCEVSLENTMACGIGACLCCVTDTTEGHVCVCTEGPVFNITKLKWQI
ncbi:MAG: dihydroorotate dehydrogenase electron transfer subunit [Bacteroidota bacterium]|nr:dihydroorotate dehydrogenase electron transfer subunit [Bacteroidota bacterium]